MLEEKKIGFIGGGFMGEAIIGGLVNSKSCPAKNITVTDLRDERLEFLKEQYGINTGKDNAHVAKTSDILILAVKPQVMPDLLEEIKESVNETTITISIAAGIKISTIATYINGKIIRVMPNMPAQVGQGVAAISHNPLASEDDVKATEALFRSVGECVRVEEELMDAVTAVSGSGPAYIFLVMEALIDAGVKSGLSPEQSRTLVLHTIRGSAELALQSGEHPAKLRERIMSPGGTTVEALHVLDTLGVRGAFMDGVAAALKRAKELG